MPMFPPEPVTIAFLPLTPRISFRHPFNYGDFGSQACFNLLGFAMSDPKVWILAEIIEIIRSVTLVISFGSSPRKKRLGLDRRVKIR